MPHTTIPHKAGFVNIIGKPNTGKSTLINALVGENVSIVTAKAQTTRHRIIGIFNGENFQVVYSDTPGILAPQYALQKRMMKSAYSVLHDADVFIWVVDVEDLDVDLELQSRLHKAKSPVLLLLNKIDLLSNKNDIESFISEWGNSTSANKILAVSALHKQNLDQVLNYVLENIPEHPAYYPKDIITDRPERFFAAEIVREKIFLNYHEEIPYCVSVHVESFLETMNLIEISTIISVERQSQKGIIIGKDASAIKKVSIEAREELERFFNKKVYLEQYVKVVENWRKKDSSLDQLGY